MNKKKLLCEHPSSINSIEIVKYARVVITHLALIIGRFQLFDLLPYSVGLKFLFPIDLIEDN